MNLLTTVPLEHRTASSRTDIVDPLHVLSQHRHQVALSRDCGHHNRQRDRPPRRSSSYFQSHQIVGQKTRGVQNCPPSIEDTRDPVGSLSTIQPLLSTVEPVLEIASCHPEPPSLL